MLEEYDGMMASHLAGPENSVSEFYDKLMSLPNEWLQLKQPKGGYAHYRITELGKFALGQISYLFPREWP